MLWDFLLCLVVFEWTGPVNYSHPQDTNMYQQCRGMLSVDYADT